VNLTLSGFVLAAHGVLVGRRGGLDVLINCSFMRFSICCQLSHYFEPTHTSECSSVHPPFCSGSSLWGCTEAGLDFTCVLSWYDES